MPFCRNCGEELTSKHKYCFSCGEVIDTENHELLTSSASDFVEIPAGSFTMGASYDDGFGTEYPTHNVTLSSYFISKNLVTQREWETLMGDNPLDKLSITADNHPVHSISWYNAIYYCNKRSIKEGLTPCYSGRGKKIKCNFKANGYRLPTEAEWEHAARGTDSNQNYLYSGSDTINDVAWFTDNSDSKCHSIGVKQPNALGIYDMSGNISEWCWDWFDLYSGENETNPKGSKEESNRATRGGSWIENELYCRVAFRFGNSPDTYDKSIGFRLCKTC